VKSLYTLLVLTLLAAGHVDAQSLRDPTVPPPGAMGSTSAGSVAGAQTAASEPVSVIVRDGRPYLVVGTRLVAVGQMVGAYKVERITETEVWLRSGADVRKVARYNGVQRSASVTVAACAPAAKASALRAAGTARAKSAVSPSQAPPAVACGVTQP